VLGIADLEGSLEVALLGATELILGIALGAAELMVGLLLGAALELGISLPSLDGC